MLRPPIHRKNGLRCFVDRLVSVVLEVSGQGGTRDRVDTLSELEFCHFRVVEFRGSRRKVCSSEHKGRFSVLVFVHVWLP
jgi:hypothetical protein